MSVLTKGLAMDFERQGLKSMSITSLWPAVVRLPPCRPYWTRISISLTYQGLSYSERNLLTNPY